MESVTHTKKLTDPLGAAQITASMATSGLVNLPTCRARGLNIIVPGLTQAEQEAHIRFSQAVGNPAFLRYTNQNNRNWLKVPQARCPVPRTTGKDCDEYPFNSSAQGGFANYSAIANDGQKVLVLQEISSSQNRSFGNILGRFYRNCRIASSYSFDETTQDETGTPGLNTAFVVMPVDILPTFYMC